MSHKDNGVAKAAFPFYKQENRICYRQYMILSETPQA